MMNCNLPTHIGCWIWRLILITGAFEGIAVNILLIQFLFFCWNLGTQFIFIVADMFLQLLLKIVLVFFFCIFGLELGAISQFTKWRIENYVNHKIIDPSNSGLTHQVLVVSSNNNHFRGESMLLYVSLFSGVAGGID